MGLFLIFNVVDLEEQLNALVNDIVSAVGEVLRHIVIIHSVELGRIVTVKAEPGNIAPPHRENGL